MRLAVLAALAACVRAPDPAPPPAPEPPPPAAAPAPDPVIALALDGPAASTPAEAGTGRAGVLWRARIPDLVTDPDDTQSAVVIGNEVFVATPTKIHVFDLATGKQLRSAALAQASLIAAGAQLVARTNAEEIGLDKQTLQPTWHAPGPNFLDTVGEYVLETPPLSQRQRLVLRRASDGQIAWDNDERLFAAVGTPPWLDGDTLYVQAYVGVYAERIAEIDVATGKVKWRAEGYLGSANAGHVVVQDAGTSSPSLRILDATGRTRWRAAGVWALVRGDIAYASAPDAITAIDLTNNHVLWRRAKAFASEVDDTWLYARTQSGTLQIIDRKTGELAGELQLGAAVPDRLFRGPPVIRIGTWLFALGPLPAPEQRKPVVARGCLVVNGCPGNSYAPAGAKVTIDGTTTATTDRRGCFQARAMVGLGPVRFDVESGTDTPLQLDTGFPQAVVFDGNVQRLAASYIGAGCHDSVPGGFP